jgi:hypothetical protein
MTALIILAISVAACDSGSARVESDPANSIWSVDLVRLLPGGQDVYVSNIRDNWAQARDIALENGDLLSFRALLAKPDSARGWDIILMTQYADSARWADREEIFQTIFESTQFERVPTGRPSSELREFASGGVVLNEIISSDKR